MIVILSSSETTRDHDLVTIHLLLMLEPKFLVRNNSLHSTIHTSTRVHIHIHSSRLSLLVLSSPQALHGLLHHIRDQSPQFLNSHLHHDKVFRRGLLLLLLLRNRETSSSQVMESRRARRRGCRRQTA